jgi:hypothetical protein
MSREISWKVDVKVIDGPKVTAYDKLGVEAYGMIEVEVPDKDTDGGKVTVDVQPSDSGVKFLMITTASGDYKDLTYKVDGGSAQTLDAPLLLIGEGAVKLLGATQEQFEFTNAATSPVTVNILVGRKAVVTPP